MPDKISIQGLEVWSRIGVPDEERAQPQKLEISATFRISTVEAAAQLDDINMTVNYFDVARALQRIGGSRERRLIETLAEDLASGLMEEFPLEDIELEIRKFIIPDCRHVSLRIKRKRKKKKSPGAGSGELD